VGKGGTHRSSVEEFNSTEDQVFVKKLKSYNSLRPTEFSDYLHDLKATANPLAPLEETKSEDVSPVRLDTKSSSAFEKPKDQVFVEKITRFNSLVGKPKAIDPHLTPIVRSGVLSPVHEKPTSFPESGWSGVSSASSGSSAAASSSFKGIANPSLSKDSAYLMKVQRYDSTSGIIKPSFSGSKGLPSVGYVPASTAFTSSSTASETPISISSGFDAMKDHKFLTKIKKYNSITHATKGAGKSDAVSHDAYSMLSSEPAKPAGISPFPPGTVSSVPISYPSKATLSSRKLSEIPEDSEYLRTASSTFDPSKFAVPSKPRADITINAASTVPFAATSDQKFVDKLKRFNSITRTTSTPSVPKPVEVIPAIPEAESTPAVSSFSKVPEKRMNELPDQRFVSKITRYDSVTGKKIEKKPLAAPIPAQTIPELKESSRPTAVVETSHASSVPLTELKDQKFLSKITRYNSLTGKKIEKKPVTSVQTPPEIKETKVTESPHASAVPMKELKDQKFLSKITRFNSLTGKPVQPSASVIVQSGISTMAKADLESFPEEPADYMSESTEHPFDRTRGVSISSEFSVSEEPRRFETRRYPTLEDFRIKLEESQAAGAFQKDGYRVHGDITPSIEFQKTQFSMPEVIEEGEEELEVIPDVEIDKAIPDLQPPEVEEASEGIPSRKSSRRSSGGRKSSGGRRKSSRKNTLTNWKEQISILKEVESSTPIVPPISSADFVKKVTRFDTFTQFEKPKTEFQKLDFEAAPISEEAIDDDFPREPVSGVEDFRQTRDEHGASRKILSDLFLVINSLDKRKALSKEGRLTLKTAVLLLHPELIEIGSQFPFEASSREQLELQMIAFLSKVVSRK